MSLRRESKLRTFAAKLRGSAHRHQDDDEFDVEIQEHMRLLAQRFVAQGMSSEEAASAARRQFGNATLQREDRRALQTLLSVETSIQDIRFALRLLARNPAFAAIAIATLALGIGANTAAFTFFNAFVLRPLPIRDPEALVRLSAQDRNGLSRNFSIAEYRDFRDRNDVFSGVIALNLLPVSLGDAVAGRAATDYSIIPPGYQFAFGLTVSGNYFNVLGGQPALGRLLTPEDDVTPGAHASLS